MKPLVKLNKTKTEMQIEYKDIIKKKNGKWKSMITLLQTSYFIPLDFVLAFSVIFSRHWWPIPSWFKFWNAFYCHFICHGPDTGVNGLSKLTLWSLHLLFWKLITPFKRHYNVMTVPLWRNQGWWKYQWRPFPAFSILFKLDAIILFLCFT